MTFTCRVDVRTRNPCNGATGNSRLAGILRAKERRTQRQLAYRSLLRHGTSARYNRTAGGALLDNLAVTLTRVAPSNGLDPHDGLRAALKGCVDGVADWLGLASDRDERVTWLYEQRRGRRGEYAVEIAIEPMKARSE